MGQISPKLPFHWGIHTEVLERGIRLLCRPIARICLNCSVPIQDIYRIFKELYLEIATDELRASLGKEPSLRQISLATGLHRKELSKLTGKITDELEERTYWLTRLIRRWEGEKQWQTKAGKPRALGYKKGNNEFEELVKSVTADFEPGSALKELERMGLIEKTSNSVTLRKRYLSVVDDPDALFNFLSEQIDTMLLSATESVTGKAQPKHHFLRTQFDNIYLEDLSEVQNWLDAEGKKFHKRIRTYLADRDADLNTSPNKTGGGEVVFSSFSLTAHENEKEEKLKEAS